MTSVWIEMVTLLTLHLLDLCKDSQLVRQSKVKPTEFLYAAMV